MTSLTQQWLALMQQHRAIAVIRTPEFDLGVQLAKAVSLGGVRLIEITWNSHRPIDLICHLQQILPDCTIGTGTILTSEQLKIAIATGAKFIFTPHTNPQLIHIAVERGIPIIPGALSPTEIITAWQAGANSVKVFPVQAMGGITYLKSLQAPLDGIPLIPTGGVTLENAPQFLAIGAAAIGLSSTLFPQSLVEAQNWSGITDRATVLTQSLLPYTFASNETSTDAVR